jgi:putative endonuclease
LINRKVLGAWGEELAAHYLAVRGYQIQETNVRTPHGEIDIVCKQADRLIFIEVKTRSSTRFGFPEEAITKRKISHMLRAAQYYLQQHSEINGDWQIDVLAIEKENPHQASRITHFENIVVDPG